MGDNDDPPNQDSATVRTIAELQETMYLFYQELNEVKNRRTTRVISHPPGYDSNQLTVVPDDVLNPSTSEQCPGCCVEKNQSRYQ